MENNRHWSSKKRTKQSQCQVKRIDVLPDDVLLEIFDFYRMADEPSYEKKRREETWQSLVHVCRRWRHLVFGSRRRLYLRLCCSHETPARDTLDVWPALPLVVTGNMVSSPDMGNIIAALGYSNRVCEVELKLAGWQLEQVLAVMQMPFPELTDLRLWSDDETLQVIPIPDSFLGGSAQRLHYFLLSGIPFLGLPNLLLSATHLSSLWLFNIPHSGYISPEAIVALLSALSRLSILSLEFQSPQSRPDRETQSPPRPKRFIVPALLTFRFKGVAEYLEDLVTFIDTPQLCEMHITFFNQIDFDYPRLAQFINRTPKLSARDEAHVQFDDSAACVILRYLSPRYTLNDFRIDISCKEPDWQLSSIEQVCNSTLHPLFTVEHLYIEHRFSELVWKNDAIENTLWLELLLPFTAVKNLYLSKEFVPGVAAALRELVEGRITYILPSFQNIFVEGLESSSPSQENVEQFVAARQLTSHPVAISDWKKGSNMEGATGRPLNVTEALNYLDTIKIQFRDRPDVYPAFLDIMKDFRSQVIDTSEVIRRAATLFHGHPSLIQRLDTLLPAGYRIEVSSDAQSSEAITVTTPSGTMLQFTNHEPQGLAPVVDYAQRI